MKEKALPHKFFASGIRNDSGDTFDHLNLYGPMELYSFKYLCL